MLKVLRKTYDCRLFRIAFAWALLIGGTLGLSGCQTEVGAAPADVVTNPAPISAEPADDGNENPGEGQTPQTFGVFSDMEVILVRNAVEALAEDVDTRELSTQVARSSYGEALAAFASDVELESGIEDSAAVLVIRVVGPVNASQARSLQNPTPPEASGAILVVDSNSGLVVQSTLYLDGYEVAELSPTMKRDARLFDPETLTG